MCSMCMTFPKLQSTALMWLFFSYLRGNFKQSYSGRSHVHKRAWWSIQWIRQAAGSYKRACMRSKVALCISKRKSCGLTLCKKKMDKKVKKNHAKIIKSPLTVFALTDTQGIITQRYAPFLLNRSLHELKKRQQAN